MAETPIPVGKYHTLKSGYRLHYHEWGTPTPGKPTVLFLHGGGPGASGYSNFKYNGPFLAEHGWHSLAPDFLGFGLSDKPADLYYHSATHILTMRELLRARGISSVVPVGNSLGGGVALHYTMSHPEEVAKLILMAPGGLVDPRKFVGVSPGLQAMWNWAKTRPDNKEEAEASYRELLARLVHNKADITDEAIAERIDIAMEQPMVLYETLQTPYYTIPQLREITCPVLGFWGLHDQFLPYQQNKVLKEALPKSRIVLSDQSGHWVMIEDKHLFNRECLDFLENG
jgi:4,5:9,10-diseco-3-hydroxy-5,9,17-trioxoandrosta-1(10),2-diene-4-oate hydrolase